MRRGYKDGGLGMKMVTYIPLNRSRYTDDQSGNGNNAVAASLTFSTVELGDFGTYGDTTRATALRFDTVSQDTYINKNFRIELDFYIDAFVTDSYYRYLLDGHYSDNINTSYISIYFEGRNERMSSYLVYRNTSGNLEYYGMVVPFNIMQIKTPYRISMERRENILCTTLVDMKQTSVVKKTAVGNVPVSTNGASARWLGIGRRTSGSGDTKYSTPNGTYLKDFKLYY